MAWPPTPTILDVKPYLHETGQAARPVLYNSLVRSTVACLSSSLSVWSPAPQPRNARRPTRLATSQRSMMPTAQQSCSLPVGHACGSCRLFSRCGDHATTLCASLRQTPSKDLLAWSTQHGVSQKKSSALGAENILCSTLSALGLQRVRGGEHLSPSDGAPPIFKCVRK